MGLFDEEEIEFHPQERYTCRHCNGKKTVSWEPDMKCFVCSACGWVDGRRTNEAIKKSK